MNTNAIREGEVDPEAVERLKAQEEAARKAGFSLVPPIFTLGTRVVAVGAENFRRSREQFESLPRADMALNNLVTRVQAEQRKDTEVAIRELKMLDDGRIAREGGRPLLLTEHSFTQLLARTDCEAPSAAATYLSMIPAPRRAREVNTWLGKTDPSKRAVVRHRFAGSMFDNQVDTIKPEREAFAVVSTRYTAYDTDRIAGELALQKWDSARAEIVYDGNRAQLTLQWHSDIQPETCAAGEVFRACAGFRTADDGSGSIVPFAGLTRNLCLNLIILDEAEISLGKRRHTGQDVGTFIYDALRAATDKVRWFAEAWDIARQTNLFDAGIVRDLPMHNGGVRKPEVVRGIFRGLIATGKLSLPGVRKQNAIGELMTAFGMEPEYTKAGIVNAITRAAHESGLGTPWATVEVESMGAKLLASKNTLQYVAEGVDF